MKKVLVAVGGTGGHMMPAEALVQELKEKNPGVEILFVGASLSQNPYFKKECYPFKDIKASTLTLKHPLKAMCALKKNWIGIRESLKIIDHFQPDVVVGFGSYHSLPPLVAAIIASCPIVLYAADIKPGRTIQLISNFAKATACHFKVALDSIKHNAIQVKHPLKSIFFQPIDREKALEYFGLSDNKFTLLIFGGSQGAKAINHCLKKSLLKMKQNLSEFQVVHITGEDTFRLDLEIEYKNLQIEAIVKVFETNMHYAWSIADLAIARSGAGTIAEHLYMEVPTIFIPYPYAMDDHQNKNADFAQYEVGGAVKICEKDLSEQLLTQTITSLLENDQFLLKHMKKSLVVYNLNHKSESLSEIVQNIGASHV